MKIAKHLSIIFLMTICASFISCAQNTDTSFFTSPQKKWILPSKLDEISGLTWYDKNTIACVNDEKGNIYFYNIEEKEVTRKIDFGKDGDYEGITYQKPFFYVINSKGKLHIINEKTNEVEKVQLPFTSENDVEGLCMFDKKHLLVALKGKGGLQGKKADFKGIYKVEIAQPNNTTLAYTLPKGLRVSPSGIYFDKKNKEVYVLSHRSSQLFLLDSQSGNIKETFALPKKIHAQPEGICLSNDGRIFISNERGSQYNAKLYQFTFKR
ncbi:SdiA-regulated domain-containing protein [Flammeovirga yaeyamensis]|uniref:SdiA-regulated domain-containing protein n=1 Tax=Flammeovirga yaeyamensis TaxID=367791 RepID=A0AAX1NCY9_9BACT|nr:SdiA-regulated domain-containing protein [Flammeovirga yaeyamensis]MBB3696984.1 uncharacterized protein YjiK [Flammeovirga yaeyamensis]NMF33647.1 hypothetical protein [Flammeovirga yaeyamensis]QWG05087.1 SdiA-regulated domain-containing protein [Flammeovirga yaeyamensis]